ncbi:MAG: acyl-CoA synthetase [Acidimicrobiales bacterium]
MHPLSWRAHLPSGSDLHVADLTARASLPHAWTRTWAAHPEAPLLLDLSAPDARWCRADELEEMTRRRAEGLAALGLAPGDRVLWSTASSLPAVVANLAALRAGLVVVPVNPAYTERELAHVLGDVRPAAAIVDDPDRAAVVLRAAATGIVVATPDLDIIGGASGAGASGAGASGAGASGDLVLDGAQPTDVALIAYTSGTTGAPKGAVLTHGNLLANSESIALTWRWERGDRLVHALPIFHGHGLCVALYTSLLVGSSVVLLPRFDADAVLDACARHDATLFFGVPTMYHRLAASSRVGQLARLRLAVSGSAPLSAELHGSIAASGGTQVLERYGMTETLMTLSNPYDGERRPGTVGFPFPGVDARVEDDGALLVRGPTVFSGYWERPAATAESFTDGWFRTGDLGVVEDGYVRLLGRSTDLIISGGYNVYPAEVEDVLLGHPSVSEVAVTGAPSEEWGEVVCAWVVPDGASPPDVDAVLAYAAQRLAPYKRPRRIHLVDALPRNAMGKVRRSELR